jgi:hypothetical protein
LIRRHHLAQRLAATLIRVPALLLVLAAGLTGCHHKPVPYVLPSAAHAPVDLEIIPLPDSPLMIAALPPPELEPPLPLPPSPPRPAPKRKSSPKEEPQPPVQVASAPEPAALAIGTLSAGGDAAPQSQQQAQDLIASILKQIAGLPASTANAQKKQIRQITNFIDQAKKALNSGDAEGARNLATKAKLLMDDLEKK